MAPWIHNDGPLSETPWPIPLIFGCPHMFSLALDPMEILLETPEIYTMWCFSNEVLFMEIAKDKMNGLKQLGLLCNIIWTENKIWQVNLVHLLSFFNIQDDRQLHGHSKVDLLLQSLGHFHIIFQCHIPRSWRMKQIISLKLLCPCLGIFCFQCWSKIL